MESYYLLAHNSLREMIYNEETPILNERSQNIVHDTVEQLYELNSKYMKDHFKNRDIL